MKKFPKTLVKPENECKLRVLDLAAIAFQLALDSKKAGCGCELMWARVRINKKLEHIDNEVQTLILNLATFEHANITQEEIDQYSLILNVTGSAKQNVFA